ncbi:MAG TPA: HesA/MoeB/ThiF family protein [Spirochaetota bacterium]|nr:HesA/MoeB/ThiF family protein [Spirochaetota bacterium]
MPMLTETEKRRYERQLIIPGWDESAQEMLSKSKVFIAGAGGLGSPVLYYLASAGVGTLAFCDNDRIDESNLNRQILHSEKSIDQLKVDSASASLRDLNSNITLMPIPDTISANSIDNIVGDVDIIIDCLDNVPTRHLLNRYSIKRNIPLIHAGVSEMHGQITFLKPHVTPCLACFFPETSIKMKIPIVGATAGIIGSIQALEAIKYITGLGTVLMNKMLIFSGLDMRFDCINLQKNMKCRVCG